MTRSEVVCPGPESLGVKGLVPAHAQSVTVLAATPPTAALPPALRGQVAAVGSVTVSGLPHGGSWPAALKAAGGVISAKTSGALSALVTGAGSPGAGRGCQPAHAGLER